MYVKLYQIDYDKDEQNASYLSMDSLEKRGLEVDASIYNLVFDGELDCNDVEDVYAVFNFDLPDDYAGRSMSVSDVVMIEQQDGTSTAYFCDSIGFKEIEFMPAEETVLKKNTITVVMVEPGERARIAEIGTSLSQMQQAVGGLIEAYYPFEEEVCIVCNDEGKYNGMNPNRAIYCEPEQQDTRQIIDIIYGPFFICDCSGENFGSLNEEQLNRFLHQYELPERFYIGVDGIRAIPYTPTREQKTER